jgi:Mitochondrial export protein Som1
MGPTLRAYPLQPFPVSELPDRSREYAVNGKTKIRKPPIDIETCDLYELVQYSCIRKDGTTENGVGKKLECFPFVRLFRRCGEGKKMYHVETTAWEGEHAYFAPSAATKSKSVDVKQSTADMFVEYGKYFWSKK